jgi:hypothetical protein
MKTDKSPWQFAETALISNPFYDLVRPEGFSELANQAASLQLEADMRLLKEESQGQLNSSQKKAAAAYMRMAKGALRLHNDGRLANTTGGAYLPELMEDGFVDYRGDVNFHHSVFLPFTPGGFVVIDLEIEGPWADPSLAYNAHFEYFEGDGRGREAGADYNETRNLECRAEIHRYLVALANKEITL